MQVLFHNSTLVGGVVIGTSADMMINIWGSMIVGGLAGAGSIFIDRFLNVIHDIIIFFLYLLIFLLLELVESISTEIGYL